MSPIARNAHVQSQRTAANVEVCRALQLRGASLRPCWTSKNGKLVRFVATGAACPAKVLLTRLAPLPLTDVTDSLPSSMGAIRDGIADAFGVSDAEVLPAWGPEGRAVPRPGAIVWRYEQERGPWGVRIEIEPRVDPPVG